MIKNIHDKPEPEIGDILTVKLIKKHYILDSQIDYIIVENNGNLFKLCDGGVDDPHINNGIGFTNIDYEW